MHASAFDRYHEGASPIHRLDPRVKVVITVAFVLSNVLLPDGAWLGFLCSWLLLILASVLAGVGPAYTLRRSFVALPFALAAVSATFALPGRPLAEWTVGPWVLVPTEPGLLRFVSIVIRSWLSVQMAILLTATTQFPDIVHALRHLHVPRILVAVIALMYRYLFVISDETMRLLRAREARSARLSLAAGGGSVLWRAKVAGTMAGQLFLRSYERGDRVYNAMLARGYRGQLYTLNPHVMHARDWAIGGLGVLLLLVVQVSARLLP